MNDVVRRRIAFLIDAAKHENVKDHAITYTLRALSNYATIGKDGTSSPLKKINKRVSENAYKLLKKEGLEEYCKQTINEHPKSIKQIWEWLKKNAHLSFVGNADTPIDTKSICSFFTKILGVRKQPGTKYMPKPGNAAWRKPMLEVITKHGVYITYAEAKWVSTHFQNKKVLVWTENSTRDGWLWIHEATNFTADQKVLCEGCCDADIDQLSPFYGHFPST